MQAETHDHILKFIIKLKNNDSQFISPRHQQLHNASNNVLRKTNFHVNFFISILTRLWRHINCHNDHY